MSFNKGSIDGRMIDVIKMEDYIKDRSIVNSGFVGIQVGELVYPIRKQTEDKPGIYFSPRGTIAWLKKPSEEEKDLYYNVLYEEYMDKLRGLSIKTETMALLISRVLSKGNNFLKNNSQIKTKLINMLYKYNKKSLLKCFKNS